jgi:uncharacterized SAM-binding protein YcdF (DUF218 family)
LKRILLILLLALGAWMGIGMALVTKGVAVESHARADAAVVLGAAVDSGGHPSPVFEGRLRHGVQLLREGTVRRLVLTGGKGEGSVVSEAEAGRRYAMAQGIKADLILVEERSRTTRQNLVEAHRVLRAESLGSALIVSDPLHLPRALRIARTLGIDARASPTPWTRYRSARTQWPFLLRESFFMTLHLVFRV